MGKRKSVPDDLMGTILSESFDAADEPQTPSESRGSPGGAVSWDEKAERVGIAFNLSKQLSVELETLRWELRSGEDVRPSKSEIAEVALRIAVEDVRERSKESELSRRLSERRVAQISNAAGTTQRSVDESGWIFETTYDENGSIIDENVVCTVADLPVTDEYVDEQGQLVSVAKDDLGNTFEQTLDEAFNTLGTRLLRSPDQGVGEGAGQAAQEAGEGAGQAAESASDAAGQVTEQASEAAQGVQDAAEQATDQTGQVAHQAEDVAGQAENGVDQAADGGSPEKKTDGAGQATQEAQDSAGQATDQTQDVAGQAVDQTGQAAQSVEEAAGQADNGAGSANGDRRNIRRAVDQTGDIIEITLNEDGEIVSEDVVGNVGSLPVEEEYVDDDGRVVSRVRDEAGNAIERVFDNEGSIVGIRVV